MRYCPICNTERFFKHIKYKIKYFWKYKIKKEPEPDPFETIVDLLPIALMAGVMGSILGNISHFKDEYKKKKEDEIN